MAEKLEVTIAEGLVIGPDDKLVIHLDILFEGREMMVDLSNALDEMGLKDRYIVLAGDGIQVWKIDGRQLAQEIGEIGI